MMLVGVDIGGTFTDVVGLDIDTGMIGQVKVPSTPSNLADGFFHGIRKLLKVADVSPSQVKRLVHGTTVATNAILEGKGAKIGVLTTKGFEDVIIIGRQFRSDMYGLFYDPETPTFLLPRHRIRGITERLDASGSVVTPLNEQDIIQAVDYLVRREGVQAIAVCYLFSFINATHEERTDQVIREKCPDVSVSLSSIVNPRFREYERTVITAFDAYTKPVMKEYIARLVKGLKDNQITAKLQVMQSRGGITSSEMCIEKPVTTLLSGPAAGVAGGVFIGSQCGLTELITLDMGGTSCDVALVRRGQPYLSMESKLGKYPLRQAMLDISTIGAGGGSIAKVDAAGGLSVGPLSAGAVPGPACYGQGGQEPTVTDAGLILGYLNPVNFAYGAMELQPDLARRAIETKVASPLGIEVIQAAAGIHRIVNNNMADQLRLVSIYKGFHPRDFTLIAMGGAGPVVAGQLIHQLAIASALIPLNPGVLSALGLLAANIQHEEVATFRAKVAEANLDKISEVMSRLEHTCEQKREGVGISTTQLQVQAFAEMRYVGQSYELAVPFPEGRVSVTQETIQELERRFHETHQRVYQHSAPDSPVEFVAFRIVYFQEPDLRPNMKELGAGTHPVGPDTARKAFFEEYRGFVETPVFKRDLLAVGQKIEGPAIVEQPDTTTVIYPNQVAEVDKFGNMHLTCKRKLEGMLRV